jgi:hypothetical protein
VHRARRLLHGNRPDGRDVAPSSARLPSLSGSGLLTSVLCLLSSVFCPLSSAQAQHVDGRVLSARDSTPIPSALVQLRDSAGSVLLARAATGADGGFHLAAPRTGRFRVAVLRIGQHPWLSPVVDLSDGADKRLTLVPPDDPVILDAITVQARTACHASLDDQSLLGSLLSEADKALTLTKLAMEGHSVGYVVYRWTRNLTPTFTLIDSSGALDIDIAWPIRSASPESLASLGFVYDEMPTAENPVGGTTWIGPDAVTLFSPWFLDTHCFRVSRGSDRDVIEVAFDPARGRSTSDIEGKLVIGRSTLELRRIEWSYVRLPAWVNLRGAGGELTLQRLPSGIYVPKRWWMRAPVHGITTFTQTNSRVERVVGWHEIGGEIAERP